MKYAFRLEKPKRTCTKKYANYKSYKDDLRKDFNERCAYCNLKDSYITTPFEIDHFVPRDIYEKYAPDLATDYSNLVYSCKKCNGAKSNKFEGDVTADRIINTMFYDPVAYDKYDEVFYRNEHGEICSEDSKGNKTISELNLYRPIHSLAWICEQLFNTVEGIDKYLNSVNESSDLYDVLREIKNELLQMEHDYRSIFTAYYNEKDLPFNINE